MANCYYTDPPKKCYDDCESISGMTVDFMPPNAQPTGQVELEEQTFLDKFRNFFGRPKQSDILPCAPVPAPAPAPVMPVADPRVRTAYRTEYYNVQVPVKRKVKVPTQVKGYKKKNIYKKVQGYRTKWVKQTVPTTKTVKRCIKVPAKKTVMRDQKVTTYKCVNKVRKVPYQVFVEQRVVPAPINMCPTPSESPAVEQCPAMEPCEYLGMQQMAPAPMPAPAPVAQYCQPCPAPAPMMENCPPIEAPQECAEYEDFDGDFIEDAGAYDTEFAYPAQATYGEFVNNEETVRDVWEGFNFDYAY